MAGLLYGSEYLSMLDYLIASGLSSVQRSFMDKFAGFALEQMNEDGGFSGRFGGSDIYYTDFALRVLQICRAEQDLASTCEYVLRSSIGVRSVVECFNVMSCARILETLSYDCSIDRQQIADTLFSNKTADFGFSKVPGGRSSAYAAFLALLCLSMLEIEPDCYCVESVAALAYPAGGYAEDDSSFGRQTNATAAALSALALCQSLPDDFENHLRFLNDMQRPEGGLAAAESSLLADLLSTFSGAVVMAGLGDLGRFDLSAMARFLKSAQHLQGGFGACAGDPEADVEYTYYGLGLLGLMKAQLS